MRSLLKQMLFVFLLLGLSFGESEVYAQEGEEKALSLRLNRDMGYGLGGQMQGSFSYVVSGPEELNRVEFLLDDEVIGTDYEAPFRFQFDTGDYPAGSHRLKVVGYTIDDQKIQSQTLIRQFIPGNSVMWIVGIIVAVVVLARLGSYLLSRSSKGTEVGPLSVGFLGGAICPKCGHPFGLHWWSLRLGISRFDRCPNCRKWSLVQRTSTEKLADAAESVNRPNAEEGATSPAEQDELEYQQLLDESRYEEN